MRSNRLNLLAAIAASLLTGASARADCNWTIPPASFDFGAYSVFGSASATASTSFEFTCNPNTIATLTLSRGTQSSSFSPRTMSDGTGETIDYNLFLDAAGTRIFGDGTSGSELVTFASAPQNKTYAANIYGGLWPQQDASVGVYNDFITATLSWDQPKAGSSTLTLTVRAEVIPECQTTAATLSFGTYQPIGTHATAPLDNQTALNVYCTRKAVATIAMSGGTYAAGAQRRMRSASNDFLGYDLFSNSGMSAIWDGTNTVSVTSASKFTPLGGGVPLYGRIPAGQDVSAGTYQDTVQALVNY